MKQVDEQQLNEKYPGRSVTRVDDRISIKIPVRLRRRNGRKVVLSDADLDGNHEAIAENSLATVLARAICWQDELESGDFATVDEMAAVKKLDSSYLRRMLRLTSLAPDLVEMILSNNAPDHFSLRTFFRGIPLSWEEQRRKFL